MARFRCRKAFGIGKTFPVICSQCSRRGTQFLLPNLHWLWASEMDYVLSRIVEREERTVWSSLKSGFWKNGEKWDFREFEPSSCILFDKSSKNP